MTTALATPPQPVHDTAPRCWRCNRKLAESVTRPWAIRCPKCKSLTCSDPSGPRQK